MYFVLNYKTHLKTLPNFKLQTKMAEEKYEYLSNLIQLRDVLQEPYDNLINKLNNIDSDSDCDSEAVLLLVEEEFEFDCFMEIFTFVFKSF